MTAPRFTVGQRIWLYDPNRRKYDAARRLIESYSWVAYLVVGVAGRSYLIGPIWDGGDAAQIGNARKVACAQADLLYRTDAEKDDLLFSAEHRQRLVALVQGGDAALLRRVAAALDSNPDSKGPTP